ncbi:hypothetical protein L1887_57700 [Cichorium endivia]|nr:hypothetical protein L1887_57700 [Cichorium endivia]
MHPPAHCIGAPSCASALSIVAVRKNLFPLDPVLRAPPPPQRPRPPANTHTLSLSLPLFSVLDDSAACLLAPSPLSSFSPPQSPPPPRRRRRVPVPPSRYPRGYEPAVQPSVSTTTKDTVLLGLFPTPLLHTVLRSAAAAATAAVAD